MSSVAVPDPERPTGPPTVEPSTEKTTVPVGLEPESDPVTVAFSTSGAPAIGVAGAIDRTVLLATFTIVCVSASALGL